MGEKMTGELKVLQRINEYEFAVEIWVMRSGVNRNRWDYRNVEENYRTFAGQPILTAYVAGQVGDGHNSHTALNPVTGELYNSYTGPTDERIVGTISENPDDISLQERDGETWIVAKGRIWRVYAPELVDKIVRIGTMEVSAETNVLEEYENGDIEVFTRWDGIGVTILGDAVAPAIPGANIKALADLRDTFVTMRKRVAALIVENAEKKENSPHPSAAPTPFTKKEGLKRFDRRQCADLDKRFGDRYTVLAAAQGKGGILVCLMAQDGSMAQYTMSAENETVAPEKIKMCRADIHFEFGGETVCADACEAVSPFIRRTEALNSVRDAADAAADAAREVIRCMNEAENVRRTMAITEAAEQELAAINVNRSKDAQFGDEIIRHVLEKADKPGYSPEMARADVRSAAMAAQMAQDQAKAREQRRMEDDEMAAMYRAMVR